MLALIYIFLTAQTISVRRLCLFFVVVLTSVTGVFGVLRERAALTDALVIAITLTLFVWSLPLLLIVRDSIRERAVSLDALVRVSALVQWTYGVALAAPPLLLIVATLSPQHHFVVGTLARLVAIAGAGVLAPVGLSSFVRRRRPVRGSA